MVAVAMKNQQRRIRKRRAEIADRYDPQRAFDEIDAADLMGYMSQTEVAQ